MNPEIRQSFPILSRQVYDRPLVYLDNAATTQKPLCVLDAMRDEYLNLNANVHRGVHYLSQQATDLHEAARDTVRRFINAAKTEEIVFTRGTTEAINLVAATFGEQFLNEGDEVIVSVMEHHSNIVPWQLLAQRKGIRIKVIPIDNKGCLLLDEYERLFTDRTRLVSVAHVSNVLGTVNPACPSSSTAHRAHLTSKSTCRPSTATSSPSAAIRCMDRRASASFMARRSGSNNCLPIKAAAR